MSSNFPTIQEILAVHQDQIEQFGGSHGLRDMGALESALFRPQMGYYDGLIEEAANFHVEMMDEHGETIPEPLNAAVEVEVDVPAHEVPQQAAAESGG